MVTTLWLKQPIKLASSQSQGREPENQEREPEVIKTGFKTDRRCAGYSKILNHAQRNQPSQMPSYKGGLSQRITCF